MSGKPDRVVSIPSPPVSKFSQTLDPHTDPATITGRLDRWLPWILAASAFFVMPYRLGSAALFEPDEGRNAEKAREIRLLTDWATPHENFHLVLDKPIFFYSMLTPPLEVGTIKWGFQRGRASPLQYLNKRRGLRSDLAQRQKNSPASTITFCLPSNSDIVFGVGAEADLQKGQR